jgi:guanylate kinase
MPRGRLIILSGPSCVGKSPLAKALGQFFPDLHKKLQPLVLYNSRSPRPGEKNDEDYHFRRREEIEKFRDKDNYIVMDVRGDLQAFDIKELSELLAKGDLFFEGNPFIGETLLSHPKLSKFKRLSMFVSPLSREELSLLKEQPQADLESLVTDVMRRKLLRRTQRQKGVLSLKDLEEVERRAKSAFRELALAHKFDHVIANHDGEDSENWSAFYYPLGEAGRTLRMFAQLLKRNKAEGTERWGRTSSWSRRTDRLGSSPKGLEIQSLCLNGKVLQSGAGWLMGGLPVAQASHLSSVDPG